MTNTDAQSTPRRIHITGVSDIHNFGDALFPVIAAHRLAPLGYDVVAASPTGTALDWPDALRSVRLDRIIVGEDPSGGLLVGGGHIILADLPAQHFGRFAGYDASAIPSLWLGASLAGALLDLPVAWNAPGVFGPMIQPELRAVSEAALDLAGYAAVRDEESRALIDPRHGHAVSVAPDTVLDLATLWPRQVLEPAFRALLARKGANPERPWLALHFRRLGLDEPAIAALARGLEAFARAQGLGLAVIAIGPGAGDDRVARGVARHLRDTHLLLDDPASLKEVAALLAFSRLYVGCSLHGYVAAAAYGVPGLLVAAPPARRFRGFLRQFGRVEDLARDWDHAIALAVPRLGDGRAGALPAHVRAGLDGHWANVAACLGQGRASGTAQRLAFLAAYSRLGLRRAGAGWGLQPLASREFHLGRAAAPAQHSEPAHAG